jgi:NADH-quinone oxidoreductase subunit J
VTLQAEFLAIVLVVVYVGAVMVLFLFVVMMLDINMQRMREGFWNYLPLGALVALLLVAEMAIVLGGSYFGLAGAPPPPPLPQDYSNTRELGRLVYTEYVYPFEIAAVILLVAIVAAIALTLRRRGQVKRIDPARQIAVKREERIRLVSMPAERTGGEKEERKET